MRLLMTLALALPLMAADPWKVGFNFRQTSGYVTDGADEVYVLGETSSTTRSTTNGNSATFQWSGNTYPSDSRADLVDRRLAGDSSANNNGSSQKTFTVTLPSTGTYRVRLALGGLNSNNNYGYLQVRDNGSALLTVIGTNNSYEFFDAGGTNRTYSAWPTLNAYVDVTFATTTCQVVIGSPDAQAGWTHIAHFYLEKLTAKRRIQVVVAKVTSTEALLPGQAR